MARHTSNIEYHLGCPTDDIFKDPKFCIISVNSSVNAANLGFTKTVIEKLPVTTSSGNRFTAVGPNYNSSRDVQPPRTVIVLQPPSHVKSPSLVSLLAQYGDGLPIEENLNSQRTIQHSSDESGKRELKNDTQVERLKHFAHCIIFSVTLCATFHSFQQILFKTVKV